MSATTFSELWSEIEAEAKAAIAALKADAIALEHQIVPVIEQDIVLVLSQLKALAVQTVIDVARETLTGNEKLGKVVTTLFQAAEAQGEAVALSDVRMLAQQAFRAVGIALGAAE